MNDIVTYSDGSTEDLRHRYFTAISGWSMMRGCVRMDMTPKQLERFEACVAAGFDVSLAVDLIRQRRLVRP